MPTARVLRAIVAHTPRDPFHHGTGALESFQDGAVAIGSDGRVLALGNASTVLARYPDLLVLDERNAVVVPGLIDAHVHYPQLGVIGGMGRTLLDWLELRTFPAEAAFADATFARAQARTFLRLLAANGTTSALVFGAHFATAMEAFFHEALAARLRITAGLVVSDVLVPEALASTPERAYEETTFLARRWHGRGRLRYAVTPRFSLSCSDDMLAACGAAARAVEGVHVTSHLNETLAEIGVVRSRFPDAGDYLETYERHGLVHGRSVYAHDLHPSQSELGRLAAAGASIAHCPCSNAFIGSGLFPLRAHLEAGVRIALGSDVGGGTSFSMLEECLVAYTTQMQLGLVGEPLGPERLLWLATGGGAHALGLHDTVGDFSPGKEADLVVLRPRPGTTLAEVLPHARDVADALGLLFTLGREDAVAETWVAGEVVHRRDDEAHAAART